MLRSDHHTERDGYLGAPSVAPRLKDEYEDGIRRKISGSGDRLQGSGCS